MSTYVVCVLRPPLSVLPVIVPSPSSSSPLITIASKLPHHAHPSLFRTILHYEHASTHTVISITDHCTKYKTSYTMPPSIPPTLSFPFLLNPFFNLFLSSTNDVLLLLEANPVIQHLTLLGWEGFEGLFLLFTSFFRHYSFASPLTFSLCLVARTFEMDLVTLSPTKKTLIDYDVGELDVSQLKHNLLTKAQGPCSLIIKVKSQRNSFVFLSFLNHTFDTSSSIDSRWLSQTQSFVHQLLVNKNDRTAARMNMCTHVISRLKSREVCMLSPLVDYGIYESECKKSLNVGSRYSKYKFPSNCQLVVNDVNSGDVFISNVSS
ncbi:hypothetical protein P9112_011661 [Eukaryota sp. TZLM1-RC]